MNGQADVLDEAGGAAPAAVPPAPRPITTVETLRNGWRMIANAWIGEVLIHVVLIQPGIGIVLLQIHPHWTPDALDLLRRRLEESGFAEARPGHLPMIHRRLRPEDVPHLDFILADAFIWQDRISLAAECGWEDALTELLAPGLRQPAAAPAEAPPPPAEILPLPTRSAWRGRVLAGSAALAAGLVILALAHRDRWAPAREAPPGQALAARSIAPFVAAREQTPATALGEPAAVPAAVEAEPPASREAEPLAVMAAEPLAAPLPPPSSAGAPPTPRPVVLAALHAAPPAPPPATPVAPLLVALTVESEEPPEPEGAGVPGLPPSLAPPPPGAALLPAFRAPPARLGVPPIRLADASGLGSLALAVPALMAPETVPLLPGLPRAPARPAEAVAPGAPHRPGQAAPPPPMAAAATLPATSAAPLLLAAASATQPIPPPTPRLPAPPVEAMAQAAPAPVAATQAAPHLEQWRLRGEAMLGNGDISGARRLLEPAARAGSAAAAQSLAETYDPRTLAQRGVIGLPPDREQALFWYRRAAALGAAVAPRIASLEAEP